MKKAPTIDEFNAREIKSQQERGVVCAKIVLAHRKRLVATKKNKGSTEMYYNLQKLLPKEVQTRLPVFITPNYLTFDISPPPYWIVKEAKEILDTRYAIAKLSEDDENIKEASELLQTIMGLTQ